VKISATVLGGSGTLGGELIRILAAHPNVKLAGVAAHESAGKRVDEVHPNLRGVVDGVFAPIEEAPKADVTFMALPHGQSRDVPGRVIDLSQDHRLDWVYGLPEIHRAEIRKAEKVAAPGCFATAAILSLWPARRRLAGPAFVSAATGSSGSGSKPIEITHHPYRATAFNAYAPFEHRHVPEIRKAVGCDFVLQPHSAPMVRGIFSTTFLTLRDAAPLDYRYDGSRFVRLLDVSPNVHWVKNSNFADLQVVQQGERALVFCAIDNLIKGGAGQAVQCMNLMFGLPEETGLLFVGGNP
jgi:N-acetyl-gamma-glutamyl-phosphate reductase common form